MDGARALVEEAQRLAAVGETEAAIRSIRARIGTTSRDDIRALFAFTLGWLHTHLAGGIPERRIELLEEAVRQYERGLIHAPGHPQATLSLELARADLVASRGDLARALAAYERILRSKPDSEAPAWRILDAFTTLPDASLPALLRPCAVFEELGLLHLARRGYEDVIRRLARSSMLEPHAHDALERWVALQARAGALNAESLGRLPHPDEWTSPALAEITALVSDPLAGADGLVWWRETPVRRHAAARAMLALGRTLELEGHPAPAADVYERAIEVAPPLGEHDDGWKLRRDRSTEVELGLALATVLTNHPFIDDAGERFTAVETMLLARETILHGRGDPGLVRDYHAALGLVYAARDDAWTVDDPRSAPYHLEQAVEAARRTGDARHPLPHLTAILAQGLGRNGHLEWALRAFMNATSGYIELEDFRRSEEMLAAAGAIVERLGLPFEPAELVQLRAIHRMRAMEAGWSPTPDRVGPTLAEGATARSAGGGGPVHLWEWIFARDGRPPGSGAAWYVGASLGAARANTSSGDLDADLFGVGGHLTSSSIDRGDFGWKVFGGYRFDAPLAVEIGYANLGRLDSTIQPMGSTDPSLLADIARLHPFSGEGITVGGQLFLLGLGNLSLTARGGLWFWRADVDIEAPLGVVSLDEFGTDPFFGAGLQFRLGHGIVLQATVERFTLDHNEVDLYSAGLQVER